MVSLGAPVERRVRRVSRAASVVIASTLLLVAWGAFAFGGVYAWAYAPLVIGSIVVGLLGCVTGGRPLWSAEPDPARRARRYRGRGGRSD